MKVKLDEAWGWAADLVLAQAEFCEESAEQENDPEQKKSDFESAEEFYALAGKLREGEVLDFYEIQDVLWILTDAFRELELEAEG